MANRMVRMVSAMLIATMSATIVPLPARAALVSTDRAAASLESVSAERARIAASLAREDVRAGLAAHGVRVEDVQARVDALSDAEAAQLARQLDNLPAGGADVLGVLLFIFIVLLITDILGLTKVFPFTRTIKK